MRQIGWREKFIFQIQDDGYVGVDGVNNVDHIFCQIVQHKFEENVQVALLGNARAVIHDRNELALVATVMNERM